MGLAVDYFYSLTPRQFNNICIGRTKAKEQAYKDSWEQARWGWLFAVQPHVKEKLTPRSLMAFPWEEKEEQHQELDAEQVKEIFSKWDNAK